MPCTFRRLNLTEKETQQRDDTLPVVQDGEEEMPLIACSECGFERINPLLSNRAYRGADIHTRDVYRVMLKCGKCGGRTIYQQTGHAMTFNPGRGAYGHLESASGLAKSKFLDAELCYYGTGYRGAAAMCRAVVEQALKDKGYTKGRLDDKIDDALKQGDLTPREHMLAHGSRLVGNDALHEAADITASDLPPALSATVSIANHLFP